MNSELEDGRGLRQPALVNHAPTGHGPTGFDPARECPSCEARRAERLRLDRRIHNQRVALRENWMIVEMREQFIKRWPIRNRYLDAMKKQMRDNAELRRQLAAKVVAMKGPGYTVLRVVSGRIYRDPATCDSDGPRMAETPAEAARGEAGPARAAEGGIAQGVDP